MNRVLFPAPCCVSVSVFFPLTLIELWADIEATEDHGRTALMITLLILLTLLTLLTLLSLLQ
jgi:hypothetical protein